MSRAPFKLLDLFSGIGGFSLGLERSGAFKTVAFCEIAEFPRKVLRKHWPEVPIYEDVRQLTAARLAADGIAVDAICGGFPCQPFSTASRGRRVAIDLWPEMLRLVRELRPAIIVSENVQELPIKRAASEYQALGYRTLYRRIGADEVGADHTRSRWWACAYTNDKSELHSAIDAEVARMSSLRDGLWGWSNYARAIRVPDGVPHKLDGDLDARSQAGPLEELRPLWASNGPEAVHIGPPRGHGTLQATPFLRHGVSEASATQAGCHPQADDDVQSQETQKAVVRGLWDTTTSAHPSHEQGQAQQRAFKPDDVVRDVPQPPSCRAARLAALGNAVVPQIPEMIGRAILAATLPLPSPHGGT